MSSYETIDSGAAEKYFESRVTRQIELENNSPTPAELANKFENQARLTGVFRWFGGVLSSSPSGRQLDVHLYHDADLLTDEATQDCVSLLIDTFDELDQLVGGFVDLRLHFAGGPDQPFDQYRNKLILSCSASSIGTPRLEWDENL